MPARFVIDKERRLVTTIGEGVVTFSEAKSHQDGLLADPDFDPTFNQLVDAREVVKFDLSQDEVKVVANRRLFSPSSRRAIVVASQYLYGIGRMLQAFVEMSQSPSEIQVFTDWDAALEWLGLRATQS